jgi:pimeloyl-ACP methyl ester carboxylesterase
MKPIHSIFLAVLFLTGCGPNAAQPSGGQTLREARQGFQTILVGMPGDKEEVPEPPPQVLRIVQFESPVGKLPAYLTPDPKDGKKHPAIIWIHGGICNSIGEIWEDAPAKNDQTAAAYRKAGIVMLFPSLRGGNDNPGTKEGFFGEVDDVLAAADFLATQEFVDPKRIYLGGHSTGGTLVLLVAEYSDRFRAVFSFGPAAEVAGYGPEYLPFDTSSKRELELRNPIRWLHGIKSPVFVFEGDRQPGNLGSLLAMSRASTNPQAHFLRANGADHFSILAPTNQLIARKILKDDGANSNLSFTEEEVSRLFGK